MTAKIVALVAGIFLLLASFCAQAATYNFINTAANFTFDEPSAPYATIGITGTFTVDKSIACPSACPALTGAVIAANIQLTGLPNFLSYFGSDYATVVSFWDQNPPQFQAYPSVADIGSGVGIRLAFSITSDGKPYALDWIILETGQWGPVYSTSVTGDVTATPLPAALPLFATGLAVIGLFGWRRKRKSARAVITAA